MVERGMSESRARAVEMASLSYPAEVIRTEFDTYFVSIPQLPGCTTEADTLEEAFELPADTKVAWISAAMANGTSIPAPVDDAGFSGRFVTRISRSLHRRVVEAARRDGVSLNAWVMEAISIRLGYVEGGRPNPGPRG